MADLSAIKARLQDKLQELQARVSAIEAHLSTPVTATRRKMPSSPKTMKFLTDRESDRVRNREYNWHSNDLLRTVRSMRSVRKRDRPQPG